jgi:hypothetical protein
VPADRNITQHTRCRQGNDMVLLRLHPTLAAHRLSNTNSKILTLDPTRLLTLLQPKSHRAWQVHVCCTPCTTTANAAPWLRTFKHTMIVAVPEGHCSICTAARRPHLSKKCPCLTMLGSGCPYLNAGTLQAMIVAVLASHCSALPIAPQLSNNCPCLTVQFSPGCPHLNSET